MTDLTALAHATLAAFEAKGLKIATVESCTGGLIAATLTEVPGSSAVVERGFVTYSNEAKIELVDVPPGLIAAYGAVSEQVAEAMAVGGLARSRADIVVSVTGIAGPGGSEFKPEGRVCFCAASRAARRVATHDFGAIGRGNVRAVSVETALNMALALAAETDFA